jgi:phosphohistidine phosphatase
MELYILRHAIAMDRQEWQENDDKRPLTEDGAAKMKRNASGILRLAPKLDHILTSPLTRARQTAEIVNKLYNLKLRETSALAPGGKFSSLFDELKNYPDESRVMIVGHQPHLGDLLAFLIAGPSARNIPLKKGGLACLALDKIAPAATAQLQWLAMPKMLRFIAGED